VSRAYHVGVPDMDEPVKVDLDPEEALRLLLGVQPRESEKPSDDSDDADEDAQSDE